MGPAARLLLLLLPPLALLPGRSAGQGLGLGRRPPLQSGPQGWALAGGRRLLSLELLEEAEDLSLALLGAGLPGELPPECRKLLEAFANSSAGLAGCLVRSAQPVRLCRGCYRHFQSVAEQLENITRAVGNSSESNCAKSLLMSDRVQVVVILSQFFNSTWEKANCASCMKNNSEGLSNSTVEFLDLFNATLSCFEHNFQDTTSLCNMESDLPLGTLVLLVDALLRAWLNFLQAAIREVHWGTVSIQETLRESFHPEEH